MVLGQAQQLKRKQRIRLREAAVLIGVMDQEAVPGKTMHPDFDCSGFLAENEVFIQIEQNSFSLRDQEGKFLRKGMKSSLKMKGKRAENFIDATAKHRVELITGDVLITKNPCGHKGDIRHAKAIG